MKSWLFPFTHVSNLWVRIVSDFSPVIWTMASTVQLQLAQNCPDYTGILVTGFRSTEGLFYKHFMRQIYLILT